MSIEARIDTLCENNPIVGWLLENGETVRGNPFLTDVRARLVRFGTLSDKQIAAIARCRDNAGKQQDDDAKRAALAASGVKAPQGEADVTGEIVSVKANQYGFGAVVSTDAGWRCWFRLPASLLRECDPESARGRRVSFRATLTRSDRDDLFAFAKRPSNARFTA